MKQKSIPVSVVDLNHLDGVALFSMRVDELEERVSAILAEIDDVRCRLGDTGGRKKP